MANLCACLGELVDKLCSGDPKPLEPAPKAPAEAPPVPVATLAVPDRGPLEVEKSEALSEGKAASVTESRISRASRPAVLREDPASRAFFCGHWPGKRNDYEGEARDGLCGGGSMWPDIESLLRWSLGYREPAAELIAGIAECAWLTQDLEVTALGRPAEPPLMEPALVSLWDAESQELLASALVGPTSRVDGFYAWEPLMEPLVLRKGQEYRLLRRPGIVNFKALLRPGPEPEPLGPTQGLRRVDREDFARDLALALTEGALGMEEVELRLAALAGHGEDTMAGRGACGCLLALLVDELSGISAMALLGPQEELEIIAASAAAVSPLGALELAGAGAGPAAPLRGRRQRPRAWAHGLRPGQTLAALGAVADPAGARPCLGLAAGWGCGGAQLGEGRPWRAWGNQGREPWLRMGGIIMGMVLKRSVVILAPSIA
eukprot:Skav218767  [mRNA]  locus=scaffold1372:258306:265296:- [translate_table: standard]